MTKAELIKENKRLKEVLKELNANHKEVQNWYKLSTEENRELINEIEAYKMRIDKLEKQLKKCKQRVDEGIVRMETYQDALAIVAGK